MFFKPLQSRPLFGFALCFILGAQGIVVGQGVQEAISASLGKFEKLGPDDAVGCVQAAHWNNLEGTPNIKRTILIDSSGNSTSYEIVSSGLLQNKRSAVDVQENNANTLMLHSGVGIASGEGSTLTVSGLPAGKGYEMGFDLYIYFAPAEEMKTSGQWVRATVGKATFYAQVASGESNFSGSFVEASSQNIAAPTPSANYFVFRSLTGDSLVVNIFSPIGNTILVSGLQIVPSS